MRSPQRRRPKKIQKQKPTHLIVLLEAHEGLGVRTIVNGWPIKLHEIVSAWGFNHPTGRVCEALPCQVKVLKKITIKRTENARKNKATVSKVVTT